MVVTSTLTPRLEPGCSDLLWGVGNTACAFVLDNVYLGCSVPEMLGSGFEHRFALAVSRITSAADVGSGRCLCESI